MLANVNFNATHQQIVFTVIDSFYNYNTARQQVEAAQSTLEAARAVDGAAQAQFDNGLGTTQDVLQAQQELAQADYELEAAQGAQAARWRRPAPGRTRLPREGAISSASYVDFLIDVQ